MDTILEANTFFLNTLVCMCITISLSSCSFLSQKPRATIATVSR